MKLQKIILLQLCMLGSVLYASDPVSIATRNLIDAQSALSLALGQGLNVSTPPVAGSTALNYKNATNLPVILSVACDGMINRQQILPGTTYIHNVIDVTKVAIEAHVNLSPLFANYNANAAYAIAINDQFDLVLTQTATTGGTIINNSGWPLVISFGYTNNDSDEITLQPTQRYNCPKETISIMIISAIQDAGNSVTAGKSCTISNDKGELNLQF